MSATNYFTYRITGTGVIDFLSVLPKDQKKELTTENIFVMTHANNSYTGNLIIFSGSLELAPIVTPSAVALRFAKAVATFSSSEPEIPISIEEQILNNGYALDPVVAIE